MDQAYGSSSTSCSAADLRRHLFDTHPGPQHPVGLHRPVQRRHRRFLRHRRLCQRHPHDRAVGAASRWFRLAHSAARMSRRWSSAASSPGPSGRICIRLRADYLAIATLGIAEIFRLILKNESLGDQRRTRRVLCAQAVRDLPEPWNQLAYDGARSVDRARCSTFSSSARARRRGAG